MSNLRVDNITDELGTGAPEFPNGLTSSDGMTLGTAGIDETVYISQFRSTVETIFGPLTSRAVVGTQTNHDFYIQTNATAKMWVGANGNVGIANTAPAQTLTVDGTIGGTIIATQAEAEAGSDNTKLMTPLRVEQALALNAFVGMNVRTFTTTAQSPYVPTTGMKHCLVIATGGGGGGGGSDAADTEAASGGGGGGAGGTAIKYYTAAQIGASGATFAIGGGGTAGSATNGTDGGTGGTTTFTPSGGGVALSAAAGTFGNGGGVPTTGSSAAGGLGGTPTGGDFNVPGGDGNGGTGRDVAALAVGGGGGNGFWGGGGRGATDTSGSVAGQAGGTNTGAGGGGAASVDTTTGAAGGAGGAGVIFILEFI
jgi:hypothetical protein